MNAKKAVFTGKLEAFKICYLMYDMSNKCHMSIKKNDP
jgi:hypothetical protein